MENADDLFLYILGLEGRLYIVHGLPEDTDDIAQPGAAAWTRRIKPILDRVMNIVTVTRPVDIDVAARVQLTYNSLNALGLQLAGIPGRKNIVWITGGVPIELGPRRSDTGDFVDFTPLLRKMSDLWTDPALDLSGAADNARQPERRSWFNHGRRHRERCDPGGGGRHNGRAARRWKRRRRCRQAGYGGRPDKLSARKPSVVFQAGRQAS